MILGWINHLYSFVQGKEEISLLSHCKAGPPAPLPWPSSPSHYLKGHLAKTKGQGKHRVLQDPDLRSLRATPPPQRLPSLLCILPGAVGCLFPLEACWRTQLRAPGEGAAGEQVSSRAAGSLPKGPAMAKDSGLCHHEAVQVASLPHHSILPCRQPPGTACSQPPGGRLMFPVLQGTTWLRFGSPNGSISQAGPTLVPTSYSPPWGGDLVTQGEPGLCRVPCSVSHMFCKTESGIS